MEDKRALWETNRYFIYVKPQDKKYYKVINKDTQLVEFESAVQPMAMSFMIESSEQIDRMSSYLNNPDEFKKQVKEEQQSQKKKIHTIQ